MYKLDRPINSLILKTLEHYNYGKYNVLKNNTANPVNYHSYYKGKYALDIVRVEVDVDLDFIVISNIDKKYILHYMFYKFDTSNNPNPILFTYDEETACKFLDEIDKENSYNKSFKLGKDKLFDSSEFKMYFYYDEFGGVMLDKVNIEMLYDDTTMDDIILDFKFVDEGNGMFKKGKCSIMSIGTMISVFMESKSCLEFIMCSDIVSNVYNTLLSLECFGIV